MDFSNFKKRRQERTKDMVKGIVCTVLASIIFGLNPMLVSEAMKRGITPDNMVFWMGLSSCFTNLAVYQMRGVRAKVGEVRRWGLSLVTTGVVGIGGTGYLMALSYGLIGTGRTTVIHFMYPVLVTVIMTLFGVERMNTGKAIAMILSIAGIMMITNSGGQNGGLASYIPAILSSLTYSFYLIRSGGDKLDGIPIQLRCALMYAGICAAFGGILLVSGTFQFPASAATGLIAVLAGILSATGYNLLLYGIGRIGPSRAAFATLLEPLISTGAGVIFYGELFTVRIAAGVVAILTSVFLDIIPEDIKHGAKRFINRKEQETTDEGTGSVQPADFSSGAGTSGSGTAKDEKPDQGTKDG